MRFTSTLLFTGVSALAVFAATLIVPVSHDAQATDLSRVDRRPGILEEPSEYPTGDQWYLYTDLGPETGLDASVEE